MLWLLLHYPTSFMTFLIKSKIRFCVFLYNLYLYHSYVQVYFICVLFCMWLTVRQLILLSFMSSCTVNIVLLLSILDWLTAVYKSQWFAMLRTEFDNDNG